MPISTARSARGRGVIVKLRDGSVVKYKRATDFIIGNLELAVVRHETVKRGRGRSSYTNSKTTRIAHFPLRSVERAELVGSSNVPPKPDPPKKKVKVSAKPKVRR